MEALRSTTAVLGVTGIIGLSAAVYFVNRKVPSKSKKKSTGLKNGCKVLFFTDESIKCYANPEHAIDGCLAENCSIRQLREIKCVLNSAKTSVDVCLYNLTHPDLERTLIKLIERDVKVRCVYGTRKSGDCQCFKHLHEKGAFVRAKDHRPPSNVGERYAEVSDLLMHHKFVIVDKKIVMTGSMNWTSTSFSQNWDHILMCTDKFLVKQFVEEFDFLFDERDESADSVSPVPKIIHNVPYQACFFRKEGLRCRVDANKRKKCGRVDCRYPLFESILFTLKASSTLDICVQQLTLEDLSNQVITIHDRDVRVRVICEGHMAHGTGSQIKVLIDAGIPVHMQVGDGTLHHKFIIVDGETVVSGSLNWTMQSFFGNFENVLLITEKGIVSEFQNQFEKLWERFPPIENL